MPSFVRSPQFRVPLALAALGAAAAGEWWLAVQFDPARSAYAWAAAAGLFVLLMLDRDARNLPSREASLSPSIEWPAFAAVLLVGVVYRVARLDILPAGLNHDVAWNGLYAIRILNGEPYTPYVGEASGRETLMFYLQALSIKWFGLDLFALVLPAVVAGILLLPLFYFWVRELFGPRLALGATFLLAVSGWHIVFSRVGWRAILQPLVSTFAYLFFVRGMNSASALSFCLAGVGVAGALYTYNAARTLPALFLLYALYRVVIDADRSGLARRYGVGMTCMAATFVTLALPMAYYAYQHWDIWQERAIETYFWSEGTLWSNITETILLYPFFGNGEDFFTTTPLLEYPAAVLLGFGVVWCLLRPLDHRSAFLILGVLVSVVPGLVSRPNGNRDIGSLPFIYVFSALGGAFFVRELSTIRVIGREVATAAVTAVALAASYATYAQYFGPHRRPVFGFYPETTALARYMTTLVPDYDIWVGGANFPLNTLLYLSYQGSGDPMKPNFTWVDDISQLPSMKITPARGKGVAFLIATQTAGPVIFDVMAERYPKHSITDLRDASKDDRVFARALLVGAEASARTSASPVTGTDAGNARVAVRNGLWTGQSGSGPGQFEDLKSVAVGPNGELYLADTANNRVQKLGVDDRVLGTWGSQGEAVGQFNEPNALAVDDAGNVHVVDTWNNRIQKFTPEGTVLATYAPPSGFFGPRGIAISADRVYVTDGGHGTVAIFTVDGVFQGQLGGPGAGAGQLALPVGIAAGGDGTIWVVDSSNNRLQAFSSSGVPVRSVPVPGWSGSDIKEAYMAAAPDGSIAMTDPISGEILEIKADGTLESVAYGFLGPTGIAAGPNEWYVTERRPPRVTRIKRNRS